MSVTGPRSLVTIGFLLALLSSPPAAEAQPAGTVHRIGVLWDGPAVFASEMEAFRQGLRDLGYVEGRNQSRWRTSRPGTGCRRCSARSTTSRPAVS